MTDNRPQDVAKLRSWVHRLGWMMLLWAGGVAAMAATALAIRLVMSMAGLTQ